MVLTAGARLGVYEVTGSIGAGAMGEVYRARDTKLGRDVALKVLPALFARDPERRTRFEREARALASLNHPHIAQIYGFEEQAGISALVMEYVDGEDLDHRIAGAPVALDESVAIARQVALALEGAHEQGIVHRDLKPSNIKVRPDGVIKVLDFGLAKALEGSPSGVMAADVTSSPTVTSDSVSMPGVVVGTAAYMAPEQARGAAVDERADIWAFGCVIYEMLTGRRPFRGDSVAETLAAILTRDPDWSALPANTPSSIRRLLRRCLEKDPARRLRHAADAALELTPEELSEQVIGAGRGTSQRARVRLAWAALLSVTAIAALFALTRMRPPSLYEPAELRVEVNTPPTSAPASFAISPDGRTIAFVGDDNGRPRLFLRRLDTASATSLAGTEGASFPFWSPDGRSLGFLADDSMLKRIDADGSGLRVVANAPLPRGGAWNKDDVIIFTPVTGPVYRVSANGGEPTPVTQLAAGQTSHAFPRFLPDGKHFIYCSSGAPNARGVYIASLDGTGTRRLTDSDSLSAWIARGHLLFIRGRSLFAQALDPTRFDLTGSPFHLADGIEMQPVTTFNIAAVAASEAGHVLYRSGSSPLLRQFVWFDRDGNELGRVGQPDDASPLSPAWSPDRRRIAVHRQVDGNVDIWLLDVDRGTLSRFTSHPANEVQPLWSPKGDRLVFNSNRSGSYQVYEKSTVGGPDEKLVIPMNAQPTDWSRDGTVILAQSRDVKRNTSIWAVPLGGHAQPYPLVDTEFEEREAQFSPDGHWFAYSSTESGRSQVYVRPFQGPGAPLMISVNGGAQPRWRSDGLELYYIGLDTMLMAVPVSRRTDGGLEPLAPHALFRTKIGGAIQSASKAQYVVSADGSKFLMNTILDRPAASPITLILNWKPQPSGQ